MVITYSKGKDQPGKVANSARGELNRDSSTANTLLQEAKRQQQEQNNSFSLRQNVSTFFPWMAWMLVGLTCVQII